MQMGMNEKLFQFILLGNQYINLHFDLILQIFLYS